LFVLAGLAAWSGLAWIAARALIVSSELPRADAIVVLAGSAAYVERTHLAAQLFHERRAPRIVLTNDTELSGWSNELQRNPAFVELAVDELTAAGVPKSDIEILPGRISGTDDEARLSLAYAKTHELRAVLIVTSAYHSRRALWIFRKVFSGTGIDIGLTAVAPGDQTPSPATWWLQLRGWRTVAGEYPKLVYYWLHY
jgi:uncharacterized SAM-binding protein YcdF (DUF218 family)